MVFKLPFKLTILLIAVIAGGILWKQTQLSLLALTRLDPLPDTYAMADDARYAEAADYLGFFMHYDYMRDNQDAQVLFQEISDKRSHWRYQIDKLGEGLFKGTSDETIGQAASVATDFFVIGDIRDLANQGINYVQGEDVDEIMVALASLGVVATTAQVTSGIGTAATAGAGTPALAGTTVAKSSLITLKNARRLGALPAWLGKATVTAAKQAKQTKSFGRLGGMLGDINVLAKTRGGMKMLARTKNATDLRRAARFADVFGKQSATLYRIGGDTAVDLAQHAGKLGKESILLAATFGQRGLRLLDKVGTFKFTKFVSRGGKMAYKGDVFALIAKLLLWLPVWLLYAIIAFALWLWTPRRLMLALPRQIFMRSKTSAN